MKKFECNACSSVRNCVFYSEFNAVAQVCPVEPSYAAEWHEVKEETVIDCNQLPKLTTEVFDRPGCPEWARYAAVDKNGVAGYFSEYPSRRCDPYQWMVKEPGKYQKIDDDFDPSDWQNSLIKRPAKTELPDWCKAGEWVYDASLREYLYVREEDYDWYVDLVARGRIKQARKREFNKKEMQGLVGKMLDTSSSIELVICYDKYAEDIITHDDTYSAERLMGAADWRIDGKPCHVLEHLDDKGEWVK